MNVEVNKLAYAISRIDGGCTYCIANFLQILPEFEAEEIKKEINRHPEEYEISITKDKNNTYQVTYV